MNTNSNPILDKNNLLEFLFQGQKYFESLKNMLSGGEMTLASPGGGFSPDALRKLEQKVSKLRFAFENDSTVTIKPPNQPAGEYTSRRMGFRNQETKTWKMLIEILSCAPHTFDFGAAYNYPDGSRKNRQKNRDYDAKWKLFDELNKKLAAFFAREFHWTFPAGYKFYKKTETGNEMERCFKFIIDPPASQTGEPNSAMNGHPVSRVPIEKRFVQLDENELIREIGRLNNDFSVDSKVHNEPPEHLVVAVEVGRKLFGWTDQKVRELIFV